MGARSLCYYHDEGEDVLDDSRWVAEMCLWAPRRLSGQGSNSRCKVGSKNLLYVYRCIGIDVTVDIDVDIEM